MAATPQTGMLRFVGKSGKVYNVSCYISDVIGAQFTFSVIGAATSTSPTYWKTPEFVTLAAIQVHTGTAVSTGAYMTGTNLAPISNSNFTYQSALDSLPSVYNPNVSWVAGAQISFVQF